MSRKLLISGLVALSLSISLSAQSFGFRVGSRGFGVHYQNGGHRYSAKHYRYRTPKRAWVPGRYEYSQVPPRYRWGRDDCGNRVRYVVRRGYTKRVWVPGYYR